MDRQINNKRLHPAPQIIEGTVVSGLDKAASFLSLDGYTKQIKEHFGFVPYPGTFNVKIDDGKMFRDYLLQLKPTTINGFETKDRTYGNIYAYKCLVNNLETVLIIPEQSSHGPEILEIISPENIRNKLGKKIGDRMTVII